MVSLLERCAIHEAGHATAALVYNIPIVRVSIDSATPHLYRGRYQAQHDAGLECMATLCLAGPASEEMFCGSIEDGSDRADYEMARHYLAQRLDPLKVGAEFARLRDAAERLVRTAWAEQRIRLVAEALLQHGTLSGEDIEGIGLNPPAADFSSPQLMVSLHWQLHELHPQCPSTRDMLLFHHRVARV